MYSKSKTTKKTSVNLFISIVSSLILIGYAANAQTSGNSSSSSNSGSSSSNNQNSQNTQQSYPYPVMSSYSEGQTCNDLRSRYSSARRDMLRLCKDAGAGSNCVDKVDSCNTEASDTGGINLYQTLGTAVGSDNALGTALGVMGQSSNVGGGCPQFSFQDYFSKKKEYQEDLDRTEEDLAKLSDDKADIQADFNKKITDLQKDLNKAQEDLEKTKDQIAKDKLENSQKLQEAQNSAKDSMRQQATTLLDLHGKLITSQRDKALNMIALTEASAKRACMKTVNEMKAQWQKEGVLSGFSSGTMIAKAKRLKQDLIDTWNDCMTVYDQKKQALLESKKQEEDMLRKQIQDTTESMAQTQDSMDSAASNMAQMNALADKQQTQAETNMKNTQTSIQTEMTAAKQELEQKLQTLATKTTNYNQKINRLNTQLSSLGAVPPSGATTTAPQVADEVAGLQEEMNEIIAQAKDLTQVNCSIGKSASSSSRSSSGLKE